MNRRYPFRRATLFGVWNINFEGLPTLAVLCIRAAAGRALWWRFRSSIRRPLGKLIALYEHKVFTQGVVWGVNSWRRAGDCQTGGVAQRLLSARPAPGAY